MPEFIAPDGARIFYQDIGNGRPVLLLHGLMAHKDFFRFQRELADQFRLIEVDFRGHGGSRADGQLPTVEQLAADIAELSDFLGLQGTIGIGWSLGATILWHVLTGAAAHRFAASVIVDMTPRVLNDDDWDLGLSSEICGARSEAIRDDFRTFATSAGHAIFAQPLGPRTQDLADWAGDEFAANDPAAIGALWASLVKQDLRPILGQIRQPTLIAHGAQSSLYGSDTADYLAGALSSAEAISFAGSGHAPHLEQPELFNQAIREFAAGLPRARETQATH
ncbi:MAG: alpha/beta hydrolase [Sphingosinicella sp.]|nr:alpha/beta hydrolase [Sphingosinicella sp.]